MTWDSLKKAARSVDGSFWILWPLLVLILYGVYLTRTQ